MGEMPLKYYKNKGLKGHHRGKTHINDFGSRRQPSTGEKEEGQKLQDKERQRMAQAEEAA